MTLRVQSIPKRKTAGYDTELLLSLRGIRTGRIV